MSRHTNAAAAIAVAALVVLSGCAGLTPGGDEAQTGTVSVYVSDQPNAIDDFRHLNVTVTEVGLHRAENDTWINRSVDSRTVDLTQLTGENASLLGNLSAPAGEYDKVFIHVSDVEGTLTDGSSADVKLPSQKLQVSKPFTVTAGETVSFVYDVTVVETGGGMYVIKPQAAKSGPDQPIKRVDGEKQGGKPTKTTTTTTTAGGQGQQGELGMYLSDRPNAIDDFRHLNVTVTKIGVHAKNASGNESWLEFPVDNRTFDLTRLTGQNASLVGNATLPTGEYTKVFIYVSDVNGTLTDGGHPDVKLPSQKLQLSKPFTVEANETTTFVFDVGVHETGSGKYIIKPQIGESGPNKEMKRVDGKQKQKRGGDGQKGDGKADGETTTTSGNRTTTTTTGNQTTTAS